MKNKLLTVISLMIVTACGVDSGGRGGSKPSANPQAETTSADGSNIEGLYLAKMKTLNSHVNGTLDTSSATIRREGNRLYSYVKLFAGKPQAWHKQAIYLGRRCPTMSDDTNGDGYLDIAEATAVLGHIIMPLDSDIGSQASGRNFYPVADLSGSYQYERVTDFNRWFRDLTAEDSSPDDNIAKIADGEGFTFEGRAVMIQGITPEVNLPETVSTEPRYKPHQNFPIACGIFTKVNSIPGVAYEDAIPGPVGPIEEVEPGAPAPGENEINPDGTPVSTTTTNDADHTESETSSEGDDDNTNNTRN